MAGFLGGSVGQTVSAVLSSLSDACPFWVHAWPAHAGLLLFVIYATHGSESLPVRERPSRILSFLLTWTWSAFDMVAALSAWVIERLMSQGPLLTWDGHLA